MCDLATTLDRISQTCPFIVHFTVRYVPYLRKCTVDPHYSNIRVQR